MASVLDTLERVEMTDRAAWRAWLRKHHAKSPGIWLVRYKKASGDLHFSYADMVEEALCFGWIDATARLLDADRSMQLLCPRKPKSIWSKVNKERLERLIAAGLMAPAGLKAIETAKANGSWTALDAVEALIVPDELAQALKKNKLAKKHFEAFPPSARKYGLWWVSSAKTEATRNKRIAELVERAERNIRPNAK